MAIRGRNASVGAGTLFFALVMALEGCGIASAPLQETPQNVATPQPGAIAISEDARAPVGDVVPVYVSVANGTGIPREIVPSQIFAIDRNGNRAAPLPPGEAARRAGNSEELFAALKSGAVGGVAAGLIGTGLGAGAGAALGNTVGGAGLGGTIGAGEGILYGAPAGQGKADAQANQQIGALALQGGSLRQDFTLGGYVFFPKADYKELDVLLVNVETGDTEVMREPWH